LLFKFFGGLFFFIFYLSFSDFTFFSLGLILLGSICFDRCFDRLVTLLEFGNDLLFGKGFTLHPFVFHNLLHGESVLWLKLEKTLDQVFEVLAEKSCWFTLAVSLPEDVRSLGCETSVVGVLWLG